MSYPVSISDLMYRIHNTAVEKGFWEDRDINRPLDLLGILMLVTTEVSEAAEAVRVRAVTQDHSLDVELADICIRVFDLAQALDINLEQAILNKINVNVGRPHMHGKKA